MTCWRHYTARLGGTMKEQNFSDLSYTLLSGDPARNGASARLHDETFVFWKDFWTSLFRSVGSSQQVNPDDFRRQNYLSVFTAGEKVVALHTYTLFDLAYRSERDHSYFTRYYSESALAAIQAAGVRKAMTMEYFSVAPEWRSKQIGVSFASIVAGVGVRLAQSLGVDAILSVARTDIGVDRIGKAFGAEAVGTLSAHNTPVELLAFYKQRLHPHADPTISRWVEHFWNARRNEVIADRSLPMAA